MATDYKTPSEIADEYLTELKILKPDVNIDQQDSDWWVRSQVVGGLVSGVYADQKKIANDAFPQSARREAVEQHLIAHFGTGFRDAQQAEGTVMVSGTTGSVVPANTEFLHPSTNQTYQATEAVTLTAATAEIPVQSVGTGQTQNLFPGTDLTVQSPPTGIDVAAEVLQAIANGRDEESTEEGAQRVLDKLRNPQSGGTESDYRQWAVEADESVSSAGVRRWIHGLGTVGVYFTAGTTNIDQAIDEGQAIVRVPSQSLIDTVADYIEAKKPLTDCVFVQGAVETQQDVTIRVRLKDGLSASTVVAGQTLTCQELVEREVNRALYKTPIGGKKLGASGYVVAADIEENVDLKLSALQFGFGEVAQIIIDRQVDDLASSGVNRGLLPGEIVVPGVVTVVVL